jgi:ferredoxin-NADP reductase
MYTTKLTAKETVAEGTTLFRFEKPQGFVHAAGQTLDMTLINPKETDAEGNMRTFSIVASPQEDTIAIATRMRDTAFKRNLRDMAVGTEVQVDGPFGSFTLHENTKRAAVFLSGGIGITPFHSIIKDAAERKLPHKLVLFYSNRRPEDTAFLTELQSLAKENPNFMFVPTMTNIEKSAQSWDGEKGYINADMLKKYVHDDMMPIYYLAGPPAMVAAMRKMLQESGVSNDDIRFEEFAGY